MAEELPIWRAAGVEPPETLKTSGWQPGVKPSAQHMNWLLNRTYKVLEELQNNGDLSLIKQKLNDLENEVTTHSDDLVKHGVYGVANGTNALTMTLDNVLAYPVGMLVAFKNTTANTGAVTLNINGLGAKSIRKANGSTLASGNLKAGGVYQCRYDGVNFMLLGEGGEYGNVTPSDVILGKIFGTEAGLMTGTATIQSLGAKLVASASNVSLSSIARLEYVGQVEQFISSVSRYTYHNTYKLVFTLPLGFVPNVLVISEQGTSNNRFQLTSPDVSYVYGSNLQRIYALQAQEGPSNTSYVSDVIIEKSLNTIKVSGSPEGSFNLGGFFTMIASPDQSGVQTSNARILNKTVSWIAYE